MPSIFQPTETGPPFPPQTGRWLAVAGTGICSAGQMTLEARASIQQADRVLYLVSSPLDVEVIRQLNAESESLDGFYSPGGRRSDAYGMIVEVILAHARAYEKICAAFYGHPGIFVDAAHAVVRRARDEGIAARMLPGISAEDCLFADLGVDPAQAGCQSYEATDFLVRCPKLDLSSALVLWQIGCIADFTGAVVAGDYRAPHLDLLAEVLASYYGPDHDAVVYEAAVDPLGKPHIEAVKIADLPHAQVSSASTLYVAPQEPAELNPQMLARLGITHSV